MAIRWRREPKPTGLAAVAAGPRSWYLTDSETGVFYMTVSANYQNRDEWQFHVMKPGPMLNLRSKKVFATDKEAKAAADAYWKANRELLIAERKVYEDNRVATRS